VNTSRIPPSPAACAGSSTRATTRWHAQLFEHAGGPRPWLVGVHGFGMGTPLTNFAVFQPERLHRELGWNVVLPSLPLHGRRGAGRMSGGEVLAPDYLRLVHLFAQGVWTCGGSSHGSALAAARRSRSTGSRWART